MRVIIAKDGKQITYEHVSDIDDRGEEIVLFSPDYVQILLNGWLIARSPSCIIEKRCLLCVDEIFLDTKVEGL